MGWGAEPLFEVCEFSTTEVFCPETEEVGPGFELPQAAGKNARITM